MRVLLLTHTFSDVGDEGEVRVVWESAKALARAGIRVFVVTNYVRLNSKLGPNLKVYRVPFGKPSAGFTEATMFKVFLWSLPLIFLKRIDIIHLISTQAPCPFSRFKIRPFAMSIDYSWEYDNSRYSKDLLDDRRKKSEEFGLINSSNLLVRAWGKIAFLFFKLFNLNEDLPRGVDLYICRNTQLIEKLRKDNYSSKLIYVPHGVNLDVYNPDVKSVKRMKNNFVFLFVGRISRRKGVEYLIRAFNKLYRKHKNVELILIGKGAPSMVDEFKNIAGNNINFIGEVPSSQIKNYYSYSDVVVIPSLGEPCSLVVREAMACGKPVTATNAGGFPDLIKNKETGLLVEPANEDELAKAMEKLFLNRDLLKQMGKKAYQHVKKELTWDLIAKELIKGYRSILN